MGEEAVWSLFFVHCVDKTKMSGLFPGEPVRVSPTCTTYVSGDGVSKSVMELADLAVQESKDVATIAALRNREKALESALSELALQVNKAEDKAHAVLRADPPVDSLDGATDMSMLKRRALARIEEWAQALGGGQITHSQAMQMGTEAYSVSACTCRREAWVVQLYTRVRRVHVAAARLSALPPDGRRSQLIDVTWLDAVGAMDGMHHGLPRLTACLSSIGGAVERYDASAMQDAIAQLELPPLDYLHLCAQPLLQGSECPQLNRVVAAVGAELCAWARLEEPLPPADGAVHALHLARLKGPSERLGRARADHAVRWWARLDLYVGSALLGHAELGLRNWLAKANASLRAFPAGAEDDGLDAPTPLLLLLRIRRHPRADAERRRRANQLMEWLSRAPPPVGLLFSELVR